MHFTACCIIIIMHRLTRHVSVIRMTNRGRVYNRLCEYSGCTTGWVNYAKEPSQAALEQSSEDAYGVIRFTRSKAAVWTVDDVVSVMDSGAEGPGFKSQS